MHHFHHIEYIFTVSCFWNNAAIGTPFKFNGKELDQKPAVLLWCRLHPRVWYLALQLTLSDKYPSMSAFMYCAGNPVVLVDPDGRDIVDADGNVIYTHKDGWSDKASKGAKIIGNAMMETETGKNEFNKLVDSDAKIQLALSDETHFDAKTGSLTLGNMNPTSFKASEDGSVVKLESAIITVFSGSIDAYINKGGAQKDNSEIGKLVQEMQATVTEMIGAVAGHEAVHTSPKNLRQQWGNTYKNRKMI